MSRPHVRNVSSAVGLHSEHSITETSKIREKDISNMLSNSVEEGVNIAKLKVAAECKMQLKPTSVLRIELHDSRAFSTNREEKVENLPPPLSPDRSCC